MYVFSLEPHYYIIYNIKKLEHMMLVAGGKCPVDGPPITLNTVALNSVFKLKYLGHLIAAQLQRRWRYGVGWKSFVSKR